ncbi:MAG TPA: type II secretion system protein [Candidatus Paceibacterota bacterium]
MNTFIKRGFTLIELLVVIAIIGLLASVVLASLNSARQKGSTAAAQQTLKSLQSAATICIGDALAINQPTEGTNNGGGGVVCAGNSATYVALPAGWIYCDATSGTQAIGNCGVNVGSTTAANGTTFGILAAFDVAIGGSGDMVACNESTCYRWNDASAD